MSFTMVKKQLFIIHLLCVITLSTSAKPIGFVKEFQIADTEENAKTHHDITKTANEQIKTENINKPERANGKDQPESNSNVQAEDSVYTQSDLEEADFGEVASNQIDDKEVKNDRQLTDDKSLLDIYTESDLDETRSQDKEKREVDKKSSSYLFVPQRRKKRSTATHFDEENGEGSGEGSGDLPTSL